ncbi:MAG: HNH endonuclease [Corynebacterium glucuronolyticum]|nr:HNH endonuclease [Corynebacterium glucuronolyticum]
MRILARDHHACTRCGATDVPLEINHIIGLAEGGATDDANLETLCTDCHRVITLKQIEAGKQRRYARLHLPETPHPGRVGGDPNRYKTSAPEGIG